jgi:3-phenylpropionate/trans-cinnamate dioxygenase ferredoxin subunit
MPEYVKVCNSEDIPEDGMKAYTVNGREILLAKAEDNIYAASDICPHMKARLNRGTLEGTIVTCPRHGSRFDLKDGHVVQWTDLSGITLAIGKLLRSPRPLEIYPVKVEDGKVYIEI